MAETIGFTGSRTMDPMHDIGRIMAVLRAIPTGTAVVTGACIGVDSFVAAMADRELDLRVHAVVPSDRSRVDKFWREHCDTFEEMPEGTTYRDRNARIVELSDRLIAFPEHTEHDPRSRRSGTWQTVRLARKAGKAVDVHVLND